MGNVIKKSIVGIVIGGILFGATNALGFPLVFQMLVFRLCDARDRRLYYS